MCKIIMRKCIPQMPLNGHPISCTDAVLEKDMCLSSNAMIAKHRVVWVLKEVIISVITSMFLCFHEPLGLVSRETMETSDPEVVQVNQ